MNLERLIEESREVTSGAAFRDVAASADWREQVRAIEVKAQTMRDRRAADLAVVKTLLSKMNDVLADHHRTEIDRLVATLNQEVQGTTSVDMAIDEFVKLARIDKHRHEDVAAHRPRCEVAANQVTGALSALMRSCLERVSSDGEVPAAVPKPLARSDSEVPAAVPKPPAKRARR